MYFTLFITSSCKISPTKSLHSSKTNDPLNPQSLLHLLMPQRILGQTDFVRNVLYVINRAEIVELLIHPQIFNFFNLFKEKKKSESRFFSLFLFP
ncbi:hypothetical protein PRUPE_5G054700 [Prunus persica]|uniref:Uncharacterized protein n=1 Tax=Prunus persica TaxID=3760 RepID=A0A251P470_PRUPE|nr:hypothetical protein PRUPE_5G054700 [Prunus persica]